MYSIPKETLGGVGAGDLEEDEQDLRTAEFEHLHSRGRAEAG